MGHINRGDLSEVGVVSPASPVLEAGSQIVEPYYNLIRDRKQQSATLAATCDALLAKPLSGKTRMKDTERIGEEVV